MMIEASVRSTPTITFHITHPVVVNQNIRSPGRASMWKDDVLSWSMSMPTWECTIGLGSPVVPEE